MQDEFKDRRLKYVDLPRVFEQRASEVRISAKQHLRACERLAGHLSRQKPKDAQEFERVEWMKDFVMKTAELNERTIKLLENLRAELQAVADDAKALIEGGQLLDRLRDQSDVIKLMQAARDAATLKLYEQKRDEFRANQATA